MSVVQACHLHARDKYTVSHKRCHLVFDCNSGVSWAIVTLLPIKTGTNTLSYLLNIKLYIITESRYTSQNCDGGSVVCTLRWLKTCMLYVVVQLSAQPSTPAVPHRPLPVCLQCRLQTTSSLCHLRSSRRASPSSQQLWSAGFFCGRPCDMELVTRQSERSGHQQRLLQAFTEDVLIFSLLVYMAH